MSVNLSDSSGRNGHYAGGILAKSGVQKKYFGKNFLD